MNKVILMGRLTRDPDVRYTQGDNAMCVARYTIAVDRRVSRTAANNSGEPTADFISCVAFGRQGEFAEKYLHKGIKIAVEGRIQTGSYTNKDGQKVYTTDIVIENHEFCESKNAASDGGNFSGYSGGGQAASGVAGTSGGSAEDEFLNIPDTVDDLPFVDK